MGVRRFRTALASQVKNYGPTSGRGFFNNLPIITSGGSITYSGGYTIHTFTTVGSQSFITNGSVSLEYLIIGGGGNGSYCGGPGGGAGGLLSGSSLITNTSQNIVVGARTEQSSFLGIVAYAGSGSPPGSGSGRGLFGGGNLDGQPGTAGQGNAGGKCDANGYASGGGGGAGQVGGNAVTDPRKGGNGGNGLSVSITGVSITYAGGGGGGTYYGSADSLGGSGGGSAGKAQSAATDATFYGGGGGGGGISPVNVCHNGGLGFQGIIIVRYLSNSIYLGYNYD